MNRVVPTNRAREERADARATEAVGDSRARHDGATAAPPAGSGLELGMMPIVTMTRAELLELYPAHQRHTGRAGRA